jgi:hypothetical protein
VRLGGSLEITVGNVETVDGGRPVFFAASPGPKPTSPRVIQRTLETVRRTATTKVTAFTDGCPGLRTARQLCQTIPCLETGLVHRPEAR